MSYQIGEAMSRGRDLIPIDGLRNQCKAKDVIMFDFEMVERLVHCSASVHRGAFGAYAP